MQYQCPLCHQPLQLDNQIWLCSNHHQFDRAKEGYVNLMPVQHKKSKNPGDNQMMMQARRQFLDAGYYQPLRDAIFSLLDNLLPDDSTSQTLLDIGCGEGYYTGFFAEKLKLRRNITVYGLDIAKGAIRSAAKRYASAEFCVASSHLLPFSNQSMDAVLRIYAPCKAQELSRVVKSDGLIVAVTPAPNHLIQLKGLIYQVPQPHDDSEEHIDGFYLVESQRLSYGLNLPGEQAVNLLQMTPFAWKASEQLIAELSDNTDFYCETDFYIRLYRKN
ncbi:23S rRNA (guanine(745)-N(1))-methyltransferase [Limnobaculum parvum]|uniref:23S rRNA (Guanine(745)-N(1))-methyltransferase n=1 Tax=Limnobaculum parvum TaxID=2172103 RepID=A0A2Y9TUQ1_9GAMM|nr:23S rRNA (guanine(745)-N(1))-methyltransferase [Limnobaculum parvum]AWH87383.1 23S rRNA (guanine(745)-N(1))-methyltransferase [Limnobaculum parvum]